MRDNPNNNMESFYDEENATFSSQNNLKRPLTLDLNGKLQTTKRQRYNPSGNTVSVLNSPDLQMLKLASPELEKFIMANNTIQTPTPSLVYPTKVTTEQELYAKGFVDALNNLRNCDSTQQQVTVTTESTAASILGGNGVNGGSVTYTNLDDSYQQITIKDEPQTVPNSPPLSPIDMESQEKIKLERKRQRNRVAASKCRKRKLERISKLEDKVKDLKGENLELGSVVKQLKEHVFTLKQQVIDHIRTGCNIPVYNSMQMFKNNEDSDIK
jgi:transcription factor AP-1